VAAFCLQETPDVRESGLEPLTHQFVSSYLLYHHLVDQGFASFQQRVLWFEPSIVDCAGKGIPAAKDSKKKNFLFSSRSGIASRNLFCLGGEVMTKSARDGSLDPNDWNFYCGKGSRSN
jgi:hypothetical protein